MKTYKAFIMEEQEETEIMEDLMREMPLTDDELQILFLFDTLEVFDLRNEEEPEEQEDDAVFIRTPDDIFLIKFVPHNERNVDPIVLLNCIVSG